MRDQNKCNKLGKYLAIKILLLFRKKTPHVEAILDVAEGLLYDVLHNGAIFAREGLGYLLTFDHLVDTSADSGLVFRPLSPKLETKLYLAWNRYQTFTPIAERFLKQVGDCFSKI